MRLYILRHGIAVEASEVGGNDAARMLSHKGIDKASDAARGMLELGYAPEIVVTSPYPRSSETAEITARKLGCNGAVVQDRRMQPGADIDDFFSIISKYSSCAEMMLVGHNPDLEFLIEALISPDRDASIQLKKGAVAVIDLDVGAHIHPGCGTLVSLLTARQLCLIAD